MCVVSSDSSDCFCVFVLSCLGNIGVAFHGFTLYLKISLLLIIIKMLLWALLLWFLSIKCLFFPVFEKPPCFAIMLLVLKALGYIIAVTGFAMCVSGKQCIYFIVLITLCIFVFF